MTDLSQLSMPLPPWREPLARALHRNRSQPFARYFQLATLRPSGRPANRTVVFRGFIAPDGVKQDPTLEDHSLKLVTDRRSEKLSQLAHCRWVEACWYFTKTREQFRLAGQLYPIDPTEPIHQQSWQDLSLAARCQFSWPAPGEPRANADQFKGTVDTDTPPDTFAVLLLTPDWVDHLELRGDPQQRTQYTRSAEQWIVQAVNP